MYQLCINIIYTFNTLLLMPYILLFLRNDFMRASYRFVKQLPFSNSAVPLHSCLKPTSICVYIYFTYILGIYTVTDRDNFGASRFNNSNTTVDKNTVQIQNIMKFIQETHQVKRKSKLCTLASK